MDIFDLGFRFYIVNWVDTVVTNKDNKEVKNECFVTQFDAI